jgi:molybdopterin-guanine dinucleotide biosynthesis protein A
VWSAAILAGGQARRFGGIDKSALLFGGRTILDRQLSVLTTITSDILIVGGRGDAPLPARIVRDRLPGNGPLGGLHTALSVSDGEATIVIACDMPFVSARFLRHLLSLTGDADAVVPRTSRGYHPLCAAYTRACLEPAAARLARGQLKLVDLLEYVRVRAVDTEEIDRFGDHDRLLANVNTEVDYGGLSPDLEHEL